MNMYVWIIDCLYSNIGSYNNTSSTSSFSLDCYICSQWSVFLAFRSHNAQFTALQGSDPNTGRNPKQQATWGTQSVVCIKGAEWEAHLCGSPLPPLSNLAGTEGVCHEPSAPLQLSFSVHVWLPLLTLKSLFPFILISISLFCIWAPFMSLSLGSTCAGSGLGRCRASEKAWEQGTEGVEGGTLSVCHPALLSPCKPLTNPS